MKYFAGNMLLLSTLVHYREFGGAKSLHKDDVEDGK